MPTDTKSTQIIDINNFARGKNEIVCSDVCALTDGEIILYQLTGTDIIVESDDGTPEIAASYSIFITKISKDPYEPTYTSESSEAHDITTITQRAFAFFNLLHKNSVTPQSLEYIVDDWLGNWD